MDDEIGEAVRRFEATPPADPRTVFDHVYAEMPPHLRAEREELARRLEEAGAPPPPEPAAPPPRATPMRGQRMTRRSQP